MTILEKCNQILSDKETNLLPANLKTGVTCLNVEGTFTSDANATAGDIVSGKSGYVNGVKITGTIPKQADNAELSTQGVTGVMGQDGLVLSGNFNSFATGTVINNTQTIKSQIATNTLAGLLSITADKIKKDEVICGVTGTYEGSGGTVDPDYTDASTFSLPNNVTITLDRTEELRIPISDPTGYTFNFCAERRVKEGWRKHDYYDKTLEEEIEIGMYWNSGEDGDNCYVEEVEEGGVVTGWLLVCPIQVYPLADEVKTPGDVNDGAVRVTITVEKGLVGYKHVIPATIALPTDVYYQLSKECDHDISGEITYSATETVSGDTVAVRAVYKPASAKYPTGRMVFTFNATVATDFELDYDGNTYTYSADPVTDLQNENYSVLVDLDAQVGE